MKRRWQERRAAAGKEPAAKPNMVCSAAVHVCWEKLFNYFDIEPRCVPLEPGSLCAPISKVPARPAELLASLLLRTPGCNKIWEHATAAGHSSARVVPHARCCIWRGPAESVSCRATYPWTG